MRRQRQRAPGRGDVPGLLPGGPQARGMIQAEFSQRPGQRPDHRRAVHAPHAEPRQMPARHHHPGQSPAAVRTPVVTRHDHLIPPSPHCGGSTHTLAPAAKCLTPARTSRPPSPEAVSSATFATTQNPASGPVRSPTGPSSAPAARRATGKPPPAIAGRETRPDPQLELLLSRYPQSGPWPSGAARRALGAIEPAWGCTPGPTAMSTPQAGPRRVQAGEREVVPACRRGRFQPGAGVSSGV